MSKDFKISEHFWTKSVDWDFCLFVCFDLRSWHPAGLGFQLSLGSQQVGAVSAQLSGKQGKAAVGWDCAELVAGRGITGWVSSVSCKILLFAQCLRLLSVIRATPRWRRCHRFTHTSWGGPRCSMLALVHLWLLQPLSCSFDSEVSYLSQVNQRTVYWDSDAVGAIY